MKGDDTVEQRDLYKLALKEATKASPNNERALSLLTEAVRGGDARAAYALATWYLHGKQVRKNLIEGVRLLKLAAEKKVSDALYDLAVCYEEGAGVAKSLKRAYQLYVTAAIWGDSQSLYQVGRCLFYGIGTKRDRRLARVWLDRAKSLGYK